MALSRIDEIDGKKPDRMTVVVRRYALQLVTQKQSFLLCNDFPHSGMDLGEARRLAQRSDACARLGDRQTPKL
jgi:hypothetical protein